LGEAAAIGASRPRRASVSVPRVYTSEIRGGLKARRGGARIQAVDEPHRVRQPRLLDQQALQQIYARIEVLVDRGDHIGDGLALLDDLDHRGDRVAQPRGDAAQGHDRRNQVEDDRRHDQHDDHDHHDSGCRHRVTPLLCRRG
jgi:hypothetical protein